MCDQPCLQQYVYSECPQCGCPFWNEMTLRTTDDKYAWKDHNNKWHCGVSEEVIERRCAAQYCRYWQIITKQRGKPVEIVQTANMLGDKVETFDSRDVETFDKNL